jgi:hypothetical protein
VLFEAVEIADWSRLHVAATLVGLMSQECGSCALPEWSKRYHFEHPLQRVLSGPILGTRSDR